MAPPPFPRSKALRNIIWPLPSLGSRKTHKEKSHKGFFVETRKRKMATNRVVRAPIRVILCAQKAMCLGYILARPRPRGRPKTARNGPNTFSNKSWKIPLCLCGFLAPYSRGGPLTSVIALQGGCKNKDGMPGHRLADLVRNLVFCNHHHLPPPPPPSTTTFHLHHHLPPPPFTSTLHHHLPSPSTTTTIFRRSRNGSPGHGFGREFRYPL